MQILIPSAELPAVDQSKVFLVLEQLGDTTREREAFLLNRKGQWLAYLNECPHWAVELDMGDGEFYDAESDRVYCKNHAALFVLPSGECETGPCRGRSLVRFATEEQEGGVSVILSHHYRPVPGG